MDEMRENKVGDFKEKIITKSNEPLIPKIDANSNYNQNIRKSIEENLLDRLSVAILKQKQCENAISAPWSPLDNSDFQENLIIDDSLKSVKLPKHVEENIKGISQSAKEYINKLEEQLEELDIADNQIINSAKKTLQEVDETYQILINEVCHQINRKRDLIRLETEVHKNEGLAPLRACRQEVKAQIRSTQHLINLVHTMLNYPHTFNRQKFEELTLASSNLGRIPAVPLPEEVPCITFCHPANEAKEKILTRISELGCISKMGPVQFLEIEERPASLYVKWHIVDSEYSGEEHNFIVQKAMEVSNSTLYNFETVYEGTDSACFIKDLPINEEIILRVGIQSDYIVWSVLRNAKTSLSSYSWEVTNKNYMITNEGKIAAKITDELSTIFSQGTQFDAEHVIEFKFLEASTEGNSNEGIALVANNNLGNDDDLKRKGSLLITTEGKIYMNGEEKLMRLPKIRFGTRISFSAFRKDEESLRITIENADKAVTYDWIVQTPLYFAARFAESNKWNVIVK